ncbi:MAG: cbiH, partial [Clostridia bacterium]|nr:cbiH [Clostridia bacterium]
IVPYKEMDYDCVDMTTLVIIGNKSTFIHGEYMVTPRGYAL